LVAGG